VTRREEFFTKWGGISPKTSMLHPFYPLVN
jgi:hypothetical protein